MIAAGTLPVPSFTDGGDPQWRSRACAVDADIHPDPDMTADAKHRCLRHCPVLHQCAQRFAGQTWHGVVVAGVVWTAGEEPAVHQRERPCAGCTTRNLCTECGRSITARKRSARTCSKSCARVRANNRRTRDKQAVAA